MCLCMCLRLCCYVLTACLAHSPYGRAAYANVNGVDPSAACAAACAAALAPPIYSEEDELQQQQQQQQQSQQQLDFIHPGGHSPVRRIAPPPPSRSDTYQPRPPPPVPAEAMASLNIGLDTTGDLTHPAMTERFNPSNFIE